MNDARRESRTRFCAAFLGTERLRRSNSEEVFASCVADAGGTSAVGMASCRASPGWAKSAANLSGTVASGYTADYGNIDWF